MLRLAAGPGLRCESWSQTQSDWCGEEDERIKTLEFAMISPGKAERAANSRSRVSRKAWLELDWALV